MCSDGRTDNYVTVEQSSVGEFRFLLLDWESLGPLHAKCSLLLNASTVEFILSLRTTCKKAKLKFSRRALRYHLGYLREMRQ